MKILHLSIIVILTFISSMPIMIGTFAQNETSTNVNNIEIINIQTQPSTIKIGDIFTVNATLANNSSNTVSIGHGACEAPFSVTFDNHVHVSENNLNCTTQIILQKLDPSEKITATSPYIDLVYKAVESGNSSAVVTFSYHQWDPTTQSDIEKKISKSFSFIIYDNNTGIKTVTETVLSPLKQFKSGIASLDVKCKQDFLLIIKSEDNLPACTRSLTALHLLENGWGKIKSPFDTTADLLDSKILGGTINEYHYDLQSQSILIKIQTTTDGNLTVTIPRKLIDAQVGGIDNQFFVLGDGREISSDEVHMTTQDRTLSIQFQKGTEEIEIIGVNAT